MVEIYEFEQTRSRFLSASETTPRAENRYSDHSSFRAGGRLSDAGAPSSRPGCSCISQGAEQVANAGETGPASHGSRSALTVAKPRAIGDLQGIAGAWHIRRDRR